MFEQIRQNIKEIVNEELNQTISKEDIELKVPSDQKNGDLATNLAFQLAGPTQQDPEEIADRIAKKVSNNLVWAKSANGFINFTFTNQLLLNLVKKTLCFESKKCDKTVVIDYSAPNIAKPFGIGHLRSTIIGQAIYNLYSFQGWETIGVNHLGDWGTQYGKLLYQIKRKAKDPKKLSMSELENLYVEFHKEAENNPGLIEEARKWFKKLENGDKEAVSIWKSCVEKSLEEFKKVYSLLDVKIDHFLGESFYQDKMKPVIDEAKEKKIAKHSRGALVIDFKGKMPPAMLLKSDGSTTYFTRDLATIRYRIDQWNPDFFVYEVGTDQKLHMQQLFETVEMLGWQKKKNFFHVAHGMYRLQEGQMSTRKGKTVHLSEVLEETISRATKIMKDSKRSKEMSASEKERIITQIAVGAIKYADLKQHYSRDIVFDWGKIMNLTGDSGPYLQYSLVRAKSVLDQNQMPFDWQINKLSPEERAIFKKITEFNESVSQAVKNHTPSVVAHFAFDLAKAFNVFYNMYPILDATKDYKEQRLFLTQATCEVLEKSLDLLGIPIPSKM